MIKEAETYDSNYDAVAIDDVHWDVGPCRSAATCDFEGSFCGLSNVVDGSDQMDWILWSGPTGTEDTGPQFDHTLQTGQGN